MTRWIAAAVAVVVWAYAAQAAPKTITLEGCAEVKTEMSTASATNGPRVVMTVKCTGENTDPKVRDESPFYTGSAITLTR